MKPVGPATTNLFVGIGIGKYDHLRPLERAVPDVEAVEERLAKDGFVAATCLDSAHETVVRSLLAALQRDGLGRSGTVLVLLWAGHASQNEDTGSLRLFATANREDDPDGAVMTADEVAELAARTRASQILILLDACNSGSAVVDVARVVDAMGRKLVDLDRRWIGVLASCQDYERAVDGALARKVLQLLKDGPADRSLRLRWNSYQAGLRGDDLVDALIKEWDEERQSPKQISMGDAWFLLPNPLYRPGAREQIVEHLLWAARGGAPDETGIWFTGRVKALSKIVAWLGEGEPGLCVVTGPAGCGKSAVAGRIVSLSNSRERSEILSAPEPPPPELDPGEGSVSAHIQARGLTLERCSELLAEALSVIGSAQVANHHDVLAWASAVDDPPVVVVDGLDEAGSEAFRIATELLAPLARYALVLVASRDVAGRGTSPSLLGSLGSRAYDIDLESDPRDTDRDVYDYVVARLSNPDGSPRRATMDRESVAREVVRLARKRV
jgi:hypothetical protein